MENYLVYVGTYTFNGSEGIYVSSYENGELKLKSITQKIENPSYLNFHPSHKYAYAVIETNEFKGKNGGALASFIVEKDTKNLKLLNMVGTKGKDPCHLCIDSTAKYIHVANYSEGAITSYKINEDGSIGELYSFIKHEGHGTNTVRQEMAHVHFVNYTLDEKHLCAVDLGLDKIFFYDFNKVTGALTYNDKLSINIKAGAGPRHFVFDASGEIIYLLNELSSEVAVIKYSKQLEKFQVLQYISTLPTEFKGENICAAIKMSEDKSTIYASNRGHDSIAVFRIKKDGLIELLSIHSTKGKGPRDFAISPQGDWLLVANQGSNNIVSFKVDEETGELIDLNKEVTIDSPVYIDFIKMHTN